MGFSRLTPSKPTVAAISGWCLAGGLELALWCDLRIATETAGLGFTERRFGVPLIDGGTQRLPLVVGMGRALELILTGRVVDAEEALRWGLVNEVVPEGMHLERAWRSPRGWPPSRRRRCSPTAGRRSRAPGCRSPTASRWRPSWDAPRSRPGSAARRASPPARDAVRRAPASSPNRPGRARPVPAQPAGLEPAGRRGRQAPRRRSVPPGRPRSPATPRRPEPARESGPDSLRRR